ncbi:MAG: hypothetical protein HZRFUVUK_001163 [Candidatus Fervidibacterota bacterium]
MAISLKETLVSVYSILFTTLINILKVYFDDGYGNKSRIHRGVPEDYRGWMR